MVTIRASDHLPHDLTEEQYPRLPETAAREIEVVHGHVIIRESPVPEHNRVARRLASSMESRRTSMLCSGGNRSSRSGDRT